jgi:fructose-bisphosphate aldolase class II
MALVSSKQILINAMNGKYGVGAYNVNNMEQLQAIVNAAKKTQSPLILQATMSALKYSEFSYLACLMKNAALENCDIPIAIHLDHGNSFESIKNAIDIGFTSVMIDGSLIDGKIPSTYEQNVRITRSVVEYAHKRGISVEGEIGVIGGVEDSIKPTSFYFTNPEEAKNFVNDTNVDSLAISIGTSHGAYKFKRDVSLAFDILKEIRSLINIPIVLHGASSIPKNLIYDFVKYGGKIKSGASGVPITDLQKAISLGVSKINIDSDIRLVITTAIRKFFIDYPEKFNPRDYFEYSKTVLIDFIVSKMKDFFTIGHAKD